MTTETENSGIRVEKTWGYELWFMNNSLYCGKLLSINKDKWSSEGRYHYHKIKDETFFIIEGTLILDWIDEDNRVHTVPLSKFQSFRIKPGIKHRFTTNTKRGCKFVETSTTHMDSDSYRVGNKTKP